jgi:hypothetical protein
MQTIPRSLVPAFLLALAPFAAAQTGALDQTSPWSNAGYNGDAASLTWQAEVQAGLTGQLEGFTLQCTGAAGATLRVALRAGAGWNTTPILFQTTIAKPTAGTDNVFVNVTSANLQVTPGSLFVIEMQGQGTGLGLNGSYVAPPGTPLYPRYLFLNGPGCFADCGWRIGFQTYVVQGSAAADFCPGDGSGTACPCGNNSVPGAGEGCLNSLGLGGELDVTGLASIAGDTLVLQGAQMPNSSALYFQGTTRLNGGAGSAFGDGLRCAGGTIIRLGTKANTAGFSQYPAAGDPAVSVRGLVTAPGTRTYQIWYRNAATFCTASTFNLSNGVEVTWTP